MLRDATARIWESFLPNDLPSLIAPAHSQFFTLLSYEQPAPPGECCGVFLESRQTTSTAFAISQILPSCKNSLFVFAQWKISNSTGVNPVFCCPSSTYPGRAVSPHLLCFSLLEVFYYHCCEISAAAWLCSRPAVLDSSPP